MVDKCIAEASLPMKFEKCYLSQKQVKYLGHRVSAAGIQPDHTKMVVVSKYPVPRNVKELRQFLGLSNYCRRFIANYSKIAEPLHKLLAESKSFHWDSECQDAFNELKHRVVNPPLSLLSQTSHCSLFCTLILLIWQ